MNARQAPVPAAIVPMRLWLPAARAGFLSVTTVGWLLGTLLAFSGGASVDPLAAALALLGALAAHAGANAINDAADAEGDRGNQDRISPFTGGSRLIQQGLVTPTAMQQFGLTLFGLAILCGIALVLRGPLELLGFGLAGLALAWIYSMPPLQLMARGVGELAVALSWALIVAGSSYLHRPILDLGTLIPATGFGLAVATILLINGFPDLRADAAAGKRTLVVRLGRAGAARAYLGIVGLMYGLVLSSSFHRGAILDLLVGLAFPASWQAARLLRDNVRHASRPPSLRPAIQYTLLAAHAYGLLWVAARVIAHAAG